MMNKRKWCYVLPPTAYDMRCDKCWQGELDDGTGTNITWSEYEGKIWCYDCEVDTEGMPGIFDGPIPIHVSYMLGLSFDRVNLEKNCIERLNLNKLNKTGELTWDDPAETTKQLLKGNDAYGEEIKRRGAEHFEVVQGEVRIKHT
jgi:hypothetical protein